MSERVTCRRLSSQRRLVSSTNLGAQTAAGTGLGRSEFWVPLSNARGERLRLRFMSATEAGKEAELFATYLDCHVLSSSAELAVQTCAHRFGRSARSQILNTHAPPPSPPQQHPQSPHHNHMPASHAVRIRKRCPPHRNFLTKAVLAAA